MATRATRTRAQSRGQEHECKAPPVDTGLAKRPVDCLVQQQKERTAYHDKTLGDRGCAQGNLPQCHNKIKQEHRQGQGSQDTNQPTS